MAANSASIFALASGSRSRRSSISSASVGGVVSERTRFETSTDWRATSLGAITVAAGGTLAAGAMAASGLCAGFSAARPPAASRQTATVALIVGSLQNFIA